MPSSRSSDLSVLSEGPRLPSGLPTPDKADSSPRRCTEGRDGTRNADVGIRQPASSQQHYATSESHSVSAIWGVHRLCEWCLPLFGGGIPADPCKRGG